MFGVNNRSSVGRHRRVSTPRASRIVLAAAAVTTVAAPAAISGTAAAAVAPAADTPTPTPRPDPLSAITNLTAKVTSAKVTLHWVDPTGTGFDGLVVRYAQGTTAPASRTAGTAVKIAKSSKPITSVSVSGLNSGVPYSFSVWAKYVVNGKTQYAPLAEVTTTTKQEATPAACEHGTVICISKNARNLRFMVNGVNVLQADVRFGAPSTPTRNGTFSIVRKDKNHVSNLYGSSMPYSMFFDGGQAIHYSSDFAARGYAGASHGCVNVRDLNAVATLFKLAPLGTTVIVF